MKELLHCSASQLRILMPSGGALNSGCIRMSHFDHISHLLYIKAILVLEETVQFLLLNDPCVYAPAGTA